MIKKIKDLFKTEIILENKIEDLSTEDLEKELLTRYNISDTKIEKEFEEIIIEDMKKIDGIHNYLQLLMNRDILKYFSAQEDEQRSLLRGAFIRTLYFKNKLKAKKKLDKLDNKRYK